MDYRERITIEPGKRSGQPCVRGLRMTVGDVLGYLGAGMTVEEVLADFPDLEAADIQACLLFAAELTRRVGGLKESLEEAAAEIDRGEFVEYDFSDGGAKFLEGVRERGRRPAE